jgi:hypothetical protein
VRPSERCGLSIKLSFEASGLPSVCLTHQIRLPLQACGAYPHLGNRGPSHAPLIAFIGAVTCVGDNDMPDMARSKDAQRPPGVPRVRKVAVLTGLRRPAP